MALLLNKDIKTQLGSFPYLSEDHPDDLIGRMYYLHGIPAFDAPLTSKKEDNAYDVDIFLRPKGIQVNLILTLIKRVKVGIPYVDLISCSTYAFHPLLDDDYFKENWDFIYQKKLQQYIEILKLKIKVGTYKKDLYFGIINATDKQKVSEYFSKYYNHLNVQITEAKENEHSEEDILDFNRRAGYHINMRER